MKFIKRIYLLSMIMGAILLFTACGKATKEDIANDLNANAGIVASDGNAVEEDKVSEIPDTISYVVVAGGRSTNVDAKIYAEGYGDVPTFAVTECEDKDEFVLKYAKKLFDKGEFENIKPCEILSREELKKELEFYEERYSGSDGDRPNSYIGNLEWRFEDFDDIKHVDYQGDNIVYTTTEERDTGDCTITYEQSRLRGYVDGRLWIMNYMDMYEDSVIGDEIYHNAKIPYLEAYCIDDEYRIADTLGMDETNIDNPCDRESAERLARQFLSRLGMDNMELLHIVHNDILLTEETSTVDGYTMIFGMSENGAHLLFSYEACETNMEPTNVSIIFATQPYVEVKVSSKGVYGIVIRGNYNEPEVLSEESTMLSFDQINEIAKVELANTVTRDIGCIEFGYLYITYDGLSYAIVPAWRYYEVGNERNTTVKTPVLTICALDGSIIYNDNFGVIGPFYTGSIPY